MRSYSGGTTIDDGADSADNAKFTGTGLLLNNGVLQVGEGREG